MKKKTIKTCITNPELIKVGQCCEVRMNTQWMEMNVPEPYVYLPAKITNVVYKGSELPCVTLNVRRCAKRGNYWPVYNLMILPGEIGDDNEIIIFK